MAEVIDIYGHNHDDLAVERLCNMIVCACGNLEKLSVGHDSQYHYGDRLLTVADVFEELGLRLMRMARDKRRINSTMKEGVQ